MKLKLLCFLVLVLVNADETFALQQGGSSITFTRANNDTANIEIEDIITRSSGEIHISSEHLANGPGSEIVGRSYDSPDDDEVSLDVGDGFAFATTNLSGGTPLGKAEANIRVTGLIIGPEGDSLASGNLSVTGHSDLFLSGETGISPDPVSLFGSAESCFCLLYTSPSPRDQRGARMPSSA